MKMLRAQYERRGPVPRDVIRAVAFEPAPLAAGQARVEILAAPINPADLLTLTGEYGILPPLPATGGSEGAGRVVEIGPGVTDVTPGQRVLLPSRSGTWATHTVVDAARR